MHRIVKVTSLGLLAALGVGCSLTADPPAESPEASLIQPPANLGAIEDPQDDPPAPVVDEELLRVCPAGGSRIATPVVDGIAQCVVTGEGASSEAKTTKLSLDRGAYRIVRGAGAVNMASEQNCAWRWGAVLALYPDGVYQFLNSLEVFPSDHGAPCAPNKPWAFDTQAAASSAAAAEDVFDFEMPIDGDLAVFYEDGSCDDNSGSLEMAVYRCDS